MRNFDVRQDLTHGEALEDASNALEQALAVIDSITDAIRDQPKLEGQLFAVEFVLEAARELVNHARTQPAKVAA